MFLYIQNWFWLALLGLLIAVIAVFYFKRHNAERIDYSEVDNERDVSSNAM